MDHRFFHVGDPGLQAGEETTGTHGWLEALEVCFFLLLGEAEGGMMKSWSMLLLRLEACKAVQ